MWHGLLYSIVLLLGPGAGAQQYFSEGGGAWAANNAPQQQAEPLANIVDELKALRNLQQQYDTDQFPQAPAQFEYEPAQYADNNEGTNFEELSKISADIQNLIKQEQESNNAAEQPKQQQEEVAQPQTPAKEPMTAQKKGQIEFVTFNEPAKALKNVEYLDKRAPISEISEEGSPFHMYYSSNNVLFIVAVTVCAVGGVVGVVGGAYYMNSLRKQRNDAFDDFTRYSPAGPGRDLRKGRQFAGSPITDIGDDSLAKAAHLHHYELTKQKIIGDDNGIADDNQSEKSDDEEDLEQHNFSVYECPGIAMSGDLEVKNPNFDQQNP